MIFAFEFRSNFEQTSKKSGIDGQKSKNLQPNQKRGPSDKLEFEKRKMDRRRARTLHTFARETFQRMFLKMVAKGATSQSKTPKSRLPVNL